MPATLTSARTTLNLNSDQLKIEVAETGDAVVLSLDGELDPHTAPLLDQEVQRLIGLGSTNVVLELSRLRFIDSSGLRVVISSHRGLSAQGGRLALRSPSATVQRLLEITGLVEHIEIAGQ